MKRTQLKDALRNIWKQKVSYLSVIVIAFLGVAIFLGISFSDASLRHNGSVMYNAVNYRDIEIMSTALFAPDDLDEMRDLAGIEDVEAVWQTNAKVYSADKRQDVSVITLTERVNQPELIEGRLPEAADECAVEQRLARDMGWQVGDAMRTVSATGDTAQYLKEGVFLIVGIANHPDHTSISIPDTLYVMVQRDAFDMDALENCFMKAEIVIDKPQDIDRFSKAYEASVDVISGRLEKLAERRAPLRGGEIEGKVRSQLDEAQAQLDEAAEQLQKGRDELDAGWAQFKDGEAQIDANASKLDDAHAQLMSTYEQLMEAGPKLDEGKAKLDSAKANLATARKKLNEGRRTLDDARGTLIDSWYKLEDAKERVRNVLRTSMGSAASQVDWASRRSVNVDSSRASAMELWITSSFKFDLNKSLKENMRRLLDSGEIPDEALMTMYMELTSGANIGNVASSASGLSDSVTKQMQSRVEAGELSNAEMIELMKLLSGGGE